ncbi:methylaspartate mutase subunit S (plasmid) [Rhodobacteraceae bacterium M382]|nr:methylaspartate mutase subunit S [Rhodobacteraceae bacterium M382]
MRDMFNEYTVVLGAVGGRRRTGRNEVIVRQLAQEGITVVNIGPTENADVFIDAALATGSQAILVSCRDARADAFCAAFRQRCIQRGLVDITLYIGGDLVTFERRFSEAERQLAQVGFNRVFPSNVDLTEVAALLKQDITAKRAPAIAARPRSTWVFTDFAN